MDKTASWNNLSMNQPQFMLSEPVS